MQKVKNKRLLILRFAGLYALTLALLVILFSAFSRKSAPAPAGMGNESPAANKDALASVLAKEEMLRLNFYQLMLNDENYQRAKASGKTRELPVLKDKSDESLVEFESLLTVVTTGTESKTPETEKEVKKIGDFFRAMLETREMSMGLPAAAINTTGDASRELEKMKMELADKQDQMDDLQARLAAAGAAGNTKSSEELNSLRGQLTATQAKLTASEAMTGSLQKQLAVASRPVSNRREQDLQAALNQKNSEVSSLQQQLKTAKAAVTPAKDNGQAANLQGEINAKNKQITQLKQQLAAKPAVAAASGDDPATVADLEKRNQNLVNGYKVMQTQLGMLQKNYNILKAENARLKQ
ncbi:MAG: hypothetical protein EOO09_10010 [Chitinophagaceae bacterium]|nr:MAG: hypothetical protein EOO09_10010 [Chitinophagaceae bacterium]